jgi:hypothetical protein
MVARPAESVSAIESTFFRYLCYSSDGSRLRACLQSSKARDDVTEAINEADDARGGPMLEELASTLLYNFGLLL